MSAAPRIPPLSLDGLTPVRHHDIVAQDIWEAFDVAPPDGDAFDLSGLTITECNLAGWRAPRADVEGARCSEVRIQGWDVHVLTGRRLSLRQVEVGESRLGALETYDAFMREVRFTGTKLGWVNLRGSKLSDVEFRNCTIDELDLTDSTATRIRFEDCTANTVSLHNTKLTHVDLRGLTVETITGLDWLRGATISMDQLMTFAPVFAHHLGVDID